jgi:ubiquinone/menaquinone biosynthesis C-methylase UbiE
MSLDIKIVEKFFDSPFYLEKSRHIIQIRSKVIQEMLSTVENAHILDIGCGDGSLSIPLLDKNKHLTLIDLSAQMLEISASRIPPADIGKVKLVNTSLGEFEPDRLYDIVICVGVLAHVPSIEAAIFKLAKCMKPGAIAIVEFSPNPNPLNKLFFPYYFLRRLISGAAIGWVTNKVPIKSLLEIFRENNLELLTDRRHSFPIPTMAHWPYKWLYSYTLLTLNNPLLSRIGVEHIMRLTKAEEKSGN